MLYFQHSPTARSLVVAKLLDEHGAPVRGAADKIAGARVKETTKVGMCSVAAEHTRVDGPCDVAVAPARHAF